MDQLKIKMRQPHGKKLLQSLASDWQIYVLLLPVVIWFALWAYKPMGGLLIAFKRFDSSPVSYTHLTLPTTPYV